MRENIFITRKQVRKMKDTSDERLKKFISKALATAEEGLSTKALSEAEVRYHGDESRYQNQHEYYWNAANQIKKYMPCLGFAYYYTEDKKYFEKALDFMLVFAGYERWHGKGWHGRGELVTADLCYGMVCGLEFFRECFNEKDIKYIADRVYELGIMSLLEDWIMPGKKIHALDTMGHNWWLWCISHGGLAALVFAEYIENGKELAKLALEAIHEWIAYKGNDIDSKPVNVDDGAYYESIGYYLLSRGLMFEKAYEKITGEKSEVDYTKIYERAADFYLNTFYPSDKKHYSVPFGDGGNGFSGAVFDFINMGIKAPELRWYVNQNSRHRKEEAFDIKELFYYDNIYCGEVKKPEVKNVIYKNIGWAIWRDSYDDNANMLAVKCGDTWNHAHADAGTFAFYYKGEDIIPEDSNGHYAGNSYLDYVVTSKAHNVILYNGEGQHHMDFHNHARNKGRLYNFVDEEGFKYVAADYTGPMSRFLRRGLRHFLWLDNFVVIYDDITAYEPGELSFLAHEIENTPFKMLSPCKREKKIIYYNDNATEDEKIGLNKKDDYSDAECMVYSITTDNDGRGKFTSIICMDDKIRPEYAELKDGCRIIYGDTSVYINYISDGRVMHKNCINVLDGITTDAVMVVEKKEKYGVVNGSIVRKNGKSYIDTLSRINGWSK